MWSEDMEMVQFFRITAQHIWRSPLCPRGQDVVLLSSWISCKQTPCFPVKHDDKQWFIADSTLNPLSPGQRADSPGDRRIILLFDESIWLAWHLFLECKAQRTHFTALHRMFMFCFYPCYTRSTMSHFTARRKLFSRLMVVLYFLFIQMNSRPNEQSAECDIHT